MRVHRSIVTLTATLGLGTHAALAQMAHPAGMSHAQVVAGAKAGGPASVADNATIGWIDSTGHFNEMQHGSNTWTCLITRPDFTGGPVCADQNAMAWFGAVLSHQPAPPATAAPGIVYMARGGIHFENPDGSMPPDSVAGSRRVTEPPHWMMLANFDPATSGLPDRSMSSGTYIMWAGTPWAHLMIMQDPTHMTSMRR
jgi:hypothetical protein